jgi:hypothetical protein
MAKLALLKICSFNLLLFILISCAPASTPTIEVQATVSPAPTGPETVAPTQGDPTLMPATSQTPGTSGLEGLIEQARNDLSQRLSISAGQIKLIEATEVEWADSSLGCPQPGMSYLQVITPGYRIVLEASRTQYEYHSNRDTYFIYCENPNSPSIPLELN